MRCEFVFSVKLQSPVGDVLCSVIGEIMDRELSADTSTTKGVMHLSGRKRETETEDAQT